MKLLYILNNKEAHSDEVQKEQVVRVSIVSTALFVISVSAMTLINTEAPARSTTQLAEDNANFLGETQVTPPKQPKARSRSLNVTGIGSRARCRGHKLQFLSTVN